MKENSDSEEEILVYAEFEDTVNIDKYRAIHILGADEKNPIIQLDETFFTGKHENALGTFMFFEQDATVKGKDPLFDKYPPKGVKYVCKTRKLVSMEHAYVTPKEGKEMNPHNQTKQTEDNDVLPVTFKDLQHAIESFQPYFKLEPKSTKSQNHTAIETQESTNNEMPEMCVDLADEKKTGKTISECTKKQNPELWVELVVEQNQGSISPSEPTNEQDPEVWVELINEQSPSNIVIAESINTQNPNNISIASTSQQNPVGKESLIPLNKQNPEDIGTKS